MEKETNTTNNEEAEQREAFNVFMQRAVEAAGGDKDKAQLAVEIAELKNENEWIKSLNSEMARTYDDVFAAFPTVAELDVVLEMMQGKDAEITAGKFQSYLDNIDEQGLKQRIYQLQRFRTALVMIEKQDIRIKPKRYVDPDMKEVNDDKKN